MNFIKPFRIRVTFLFVLPFLGACLTPPPPKISRAKPAPGTQITGLVLEQIIGKAGTGPGEFTAPQGICTDADGNLYVADTGNDRIQKFSSRGKYLIQTGGFGWDAGQFSRPTNLFVYNNLDLWVVDSRNIRVQHLDKKLTVSASFPLKDYLDPENEPGVLYGIGISPGGDLFVSDPDNGALYSFNPFATHHRTFGDFGYGEGYVQEPTGIALDQRGELYVCDRLRGRLVRFDVFGNFLEETGAGELAAPMGAAVDKWGYIFVADTDNHRVAVFDTEGTLILSVGTGGKGNRLFREPYDVALDGLGILYVSDRGGNCIRKFRIIRQVQP